MEIMLCCLVYLIAMSTSRIQANYILAKWGHILPEWLSQ